VSVNKPLFLYNLPAFILLTLSTRGLWPCWFFPPCLCKLKDYILLKCLVYLPSCQTGQSVTLDHLRSHIYTKIFRCLFSCCH